MSQVCIFIGTRAHTVLSPRSLLQVLGALSPLQLTGGSTRPAVENVENVESQASPRCFPRKDARTGVILKGKQSCGQLSVLPLHFPSLNCLFPHLLHNLFATGQEAADPLPDASACHNPPPSSACMAARVRTVAKEQQLPSMAVCAWIAGREQDGMTSSKAA